VIIWKKKERPPKILWKQLPKIRNEAKKLGSRFYFTGKKDVNGEISIKYTSSGTTATFYLKDSYRKHRNKYEKTPHIQNYRKKYRKSNKKKIKKLIENFKKKNPDYDMLWNRKNYKDPEKRARRRKIKREWERARKISDPGYKIIKSHYSRINQLIKNSKSKKTMQLLGCSREFFINHLKKQFKNGMTIKNYGTVWHVDHIIRLHTFRNLATSPKEQKIAFNYINTRPMFAQENLRRPKGLKIIDY
tara:strand:+ start:91 stop:828 length:738 start_codon:yes stop_codon:yes gene_type:complete